MSEIKMTPEQAKAIVTQFDITTFDGWADAVKALLAGQSEWTVLQDNEAGTYLMASPDHGVMCAEMRWDEELFTEDEFAPVHPVAWNEETGCWDGLNPEACAAVLLHPTFVILNHD